MSRPIVPAGSFIGATVDDEPAMHDFVVEAIVSYLGTAPVSGDISSAVKGGFWSDIDATAPRVWRLRDRVLVGSAAPSHVARNGSNGTWLSNESGTAAWGLRDGQFVVMSDVGGLAVVGASRLSDHYTSLEAIPGATPAAIGVSGFVVNDGNIEKPAWAMYADIQHEPVGGLAQSYGLEVAGKNKGPDYTSQPYQLTWGVYGLWLAGGGHAVYGGAPTNPSNAAIVVLKNDHTWNKGIIFAATALTGTDGTDSGSATAIEMAKNHQIRWLKPDGTPGATIRSGVTTANKSITVLFSDDQMRVGGPSLAAILDVNHTTGAVNSIVVRNSVTTVAPSIGAQGSDTNVDLSLVAKGSGVVRFGSHSAIGAEAITGYITIKDSGGTTRKLAVVS